MSGKSNSLRAVFFALGSNIIITGIKFIVSVITNSAGMLAEAIHSVADCGNQIFLLIGERRSSGRPSELHPFGLGKEEYFWGFLVAVLLFFVGAAFSITEGIHKLFHPTGIQNICWSFIVLTVSILIEGKSFHVAYHAFAKTRNGAGMFRALVDTTDTNLFVILLEDSAALTGLSIVMVSTLLAWLVNPVFDAIGSILVGILLVAVSLFMINELRKLIVGENIPRELRNEFSDIVVSNHVIERVNFISAEMVGKGKFILVVGVDLVDDVKASEVEEELEKIRNELNKRNKDIHSVFFDIRDLKREPGSTITKNI